MSKYVVTGGAGFKCQAEGLCQACYGKAPKE